MKPHKFWHVFLVISEHIIKAPLHLFESIVFMLIGVMILTSKISVLSFIIGIPLIVFGTAYLLIKIQDAFGGISNKEYQRSECPICNAPPGDEKLSGN